MKSSKKIKKKVYVALCADILHAGHINILKKASKYGEITVGLLTDRAISKYKNKTLIDYKNRKLVVESLLFVKKVIPQNTLSYKKNLLKLKPDYVFHGDDWKRGVQKKTREEVLSCLTKWNGKLIEPKYTKGISSSILKKIAKYSKNNN